MSEEKSKLQLIGEIAEANNKNLELIEEIDRLNNLNKQLVEECQRLDDEEARLNNIIDELEKGLEYELEEMSYNYCEANPFRMEKMLNMIKELKENK